MEIKILQQRCRKKNLSLPFESISSEIDKLIVKGGIRLLSARPNPFVLPSAMAQWAKARKRATEKAETT